MQRLMDHAERMSDNTVEVHGTVILNGEERLSECAEKNQLELAKIAYQVGVEKFSLAQPAGIIFWSGRRWTPSILRAGLGVAVGWPRHSRAGKC